jgi:hypothetical protein
LNKFEFEFQSISDVSQDIASLQLLIAQFRTPFWLETKHWFVTVVASKKRHTLNLHSIPVCAPKIFYNSKSNKISCSTAPRIDSDSTNMNNVCDVSLDLVDMMADDNVEKVCFNQT